MSVFSRWHRDFKSKSKLNIFGSCFWTYIVACQLELQLLRQGFFKKRILRQCPALACTNRVIGAGKACWYQPPTWIDIFKRFSIFEVVYFPCDATHPELCQHAFALEGFFNHLSQHQVVIHRSRTNGSTNTRRGESVCPVKSEGASLSFHESFRPVLVSTR